MLKISAIGNLGNDATVRHHNGKAAISFSIAHNEVYRDKDGVKHSTTTWINCTYWRKPDSQLSAYLTKGSLVYVEGLPSVKVYRSKTGEHVPDLTVTVSRLDLLQSTKDSAPWEE